VNKQAPRVVLINCFTNAKTQQVITMDCRSRRVLYCFHHGKRDKSGPLHRKHNGVALPQKENLLGGENVDVEGHPSCCQQTADLFKLSVLVLLLAESLGDERRQTDVYNGKVYDLYIFDKNINLLFSLSKFCGFSKLSKSDKST
jgi:hypothetical protein